MCEEYVWCYPGTCRAGIDNNEDFAVGVITCEDFWWVSGIPLLGGNLQLLFVANKQTSLSHHGHGAECECCSVCIYQ